MSPIIYTPHKCETPAPQDMAAPMPYGTLWQCETCEAIWQAEDARSGLWYQVKNPRRARRIEEASQGHPAQPEPPTTPRVAPDIVQLVLDTYAEHMTVTPNDGAEPLGWCGECETGIYGPHTIQAHAREKATEALQDALAKADPAPSVLPASMVAVLDAWRVPGPHPELHEAAKARVWGHFSLLALRLDKACAEHPGGDDA